MNKIELLAPAGKKEAFIGAINAGANAIYLAGKRFGARGLAENFTKEEIVELISYAHLRNVLVYITINTLIMENEIEDLLDYTDFLVKNNVDAFIIQDIGVLLLLRKRYKNIKLHASTQMNAYSLNQVKALKKLGVDRVILSREVSIDEIKKIKNNVDIELEVFVHGALCASYSGNCLFSSILSNRSGNRGFCAQSCRLPFSIYQDNKIIDKNIYLLSLKDLMTLEYISKLKGLVDSVKIEGRLRSNEYVIQAVSSYKKALSDIPFDKNQEIDKLKRTFNRGFTKGNMFNEKDEDIFNQERPNHQGVFLGTVVEYKAPYIKVILQDEINLKDGIRIISNEEFGFHIDEILDINKQSVRKAKPRETIYLYTKFHCKKGDLILKTYDNKLSEELKSYLIKDFKMIPLVGTIHLYANKEISLTLLDDLGNKVITLGAKALESITKPLLKRDIFNQVSKLGNTPFYFKELNINTDNNSFLPIKELNELRRKAIEKITFLRIKREEPVINDIAFKNRFDKIELGNKTSIKVNTKDQLQIALQSDFDYIYYKDGIKSDEADDRLIPFYPRITHSKAMNSKSILSDIGDFVNLKKEGLSIADKYFNCYNSYSIECLLLNGVKRVTFSDELKPNEIIKVLDSFYLRNSFYPNTEVMVYGPYELMILKNNPLHKYKNQENIYIKDLNKNSYFLKKDKNNTTTILYNNKNLLNDITVLKRIP
ncbi:U32 family peptidase, partial [Acholeplasma sp. OttesenSCG-928-E16]|nr:U32 family peptidase [Acholeplasma sp. OttesenSCG-928-E16]